MLEFCDEIIYFVSNVVILLNVPLNRQRFYTEHIQEVISMAVSNSNGDIIATGELAVHRPEIHIWNSRSLKNINVIKGIHEKGIHLLAFSTDDRYLISCGLDNPSAVIINDWFEGTVIISTSV
jgi:WD40 repeat protein